MSGDVDGAIASLRGHFGIDTDSELARFLRVDKSTVSSWRARGRAPDRFLKILDGGSHEAINTPPSIWGPHEDAAFNLGLFRYTRLMGRMSLDGGFQICFAIFSSKAILWVFYNDAHSDLILFQNATSHDLPTAFVCLLHDDHAAPESSMDRDLNHLRKKMSFLGDEILDQLQPRVGSSTSEPPKGRK